MIEFEGVQYARVTSDILAPFSEFAQLQGPAREKADRKARIGTAVHLAISAHLTGCPYDLQPDEEPYFESFLKWKQFAHPIFWWEPEQRLYCRVKRITGCIDGLIRFGGDLPCLVDYKCSANESPTTWSMQGHLYKYLLGINGHIVSNRLIFAKLDSKGELPHVFQYKISDETMDKCMKAIDDFWEKKENGLEEIGC